MDRKQLGFCIVLSLCSLLSAFTQQGEQAAYIIFAEGESFNIIRSEEELVFDLLYDSVIGLELYSGDYVNTDSGTFLEIQLQGSRNVLKISENSSFTISNVTKKGGGAFRLTYGRIRAKVEKLFDEDRFHIRGPGIIAGVRGTDFGYDIIAQTGGLGQENELVANVYCFEGEVEIGKIETVKKETTEEGEPEYEEKVTETVVIASNQMASVPVEEPTKPIEKTEIAESVSDYWKANDFKGETVEPEILPTLSSVKAEEQKTEEETEKPIEQSAKVGEEKKEPPSTPPETEEAEEPAREESKEETKEPILPTLTLSQQMRTTGTVLTILGALVETGSILTFFLGEDILPLDPVVVKDIAKGGMLIGGIALGGGLINLIGSLLAE